jgi:phage terminase large subunit-like protein
MIRAERQQLESSFYLFFLDAWKVLNPDTNLVDNWHIRFFCNEVQVMLERLLQGEKKLYDLCIATPPKTGKSQIFSVTLPVYIWVRSPSLKIITSSYSPELSTRDAIDSRKLIRSEWFQNLFSHKFQLTNEVMDFITNDHGGERRVTTPYSSKTGHRADIILADDPNRASDRFSQIERDHVNEWWDSTMWSRLDNQETGFRIIIQQRIDNNDLTGHVKSIYPDKYAFISLPADLSKGHEPTPIAVKQFYRDNLLFPGRISRDVLAEAALIMGSAFEGQYYQSPIVTGGRFYKESWFQWYTESQRPVFDCQIISVDTAFTNTSCPVSIQVWGKAGPNLYCDYELNEKLTGEQTEIAIRRLADRIPGVVIVVEKASNGFMIIDSLSKYYRVYPFIPNRYGGKEIRASNVSSLYWQGFVHVKDTPYMRTKFLQEFLEFPAGSKDRVDSASQALIYLTQLIPQTSKLLHLGHDGHQMDNIVILGQPNKG